MLWEGPAVSWETAGPSRTSRCGSLLALPDVFARVLRARTAAAAAAGAEAVFDALRVRGEPRTGRQEQHLEPERVLVRGVVLDALPLILHLVDQVRGGLGDGVEHLARLDRRCGHTTSR